MPTVSIIVPVYKVEKYIHHCIDSILNQTYRDFELILVDDGSPDNCGTICDNYAAKDNRVRVIHKENGGLSSARNAGLKVASGVYVLFCDSDDYVSPVWCETMYHCIHNHPNAFIVSNLWKVTNGITRAYQPPSEEVKRTDYFSLYKMGVSAYAVNKIYVLKTLLEHNLYFDESCTFAEDVGFNAQYCALCNECFFIAKPLYYYITNEEGIMHKYSPNTFKLHIPLFWYRLPLISDSNIGEYCDIWVYHFINLFDNVFDQRNTMPFLQKLRYNQKMLQSYEVQYCLHHAAGRTEHPRVLKLLKNKNYYLYWLLTSFTNLKRKIRSLKS